jgi:hypothetical protein
MRRRAFMLTVLLLGALAAMAAMAAPAAAQGPIRFRTWGVRAGVSDNPDQVVIGVHADLGELAPRVLLRPNIELGFGDGHTIASVTVPVHYRVPLRGGFGIYAGGGIVVGLIDTDHGPDEGSDLAISPMAAGGVEWPGRQGSFFSELNLIGGDFPNAKLLVGWTF